jgi:hypothetical protein
MCISNHGNTISFWEDLINGRVHSDIFPHLMGFVKDRLGDQRGGE